MSAAPAIVRLGPFRLGCRQALPPEDLQRLAETFAATGKAPDGEALGGRAPMTRLELASVGPALVKPYRRGGALGRIVRHTYLKGGLRRSQAEYEWLLRAEGLGVSVPRPVAYGFRGDWLYCCWLVTQAVSGARSLAQVSLQTAAAIPPLLEEVARQVNILVGEGIWHPDLHPGNVLVDDRGRVVLIDFDKVARVGGSRRRLWRRYRRRWRRAVVKHKLPAALAAGLEAAAAALET